MKICFMSDTHNLRLKNLKLADVYVHCGDACGVGSANELRYFYKWYGNLPNTKIYVPGNHDMSYNNVPCPSSIICLKDAGVTIDGIRFYGMPWMPMFGSWAFMLPDGARQRYINAIPETDILITHAPADVLAANNIGMFCGDLLLAKRIAEIKPKIHCFGHIHESAGFWYNPETGLCSINVAYAMDRKVIYYDTEADEWTDEWTASTA